MIDLDDNFIREKKQELREMRTIRDLIKHNELKPFNGIIEVKKLIDKKIRTLELTLEEVK